MMATSKHNSVLLAAVLIAAAVLFSAIPSTHAAASASTPKKPRLGVSTVPSQVAVDAASVGFASVVFPLYGDVYPHGLYYASMSIGDPPKPYFLDVDTGSDLTWLQCDAPCVRCSKGPHPLYKPTKNKLVPCQDPLCEAVQRATGMRDENGCEPNQQCDYVVGYADQGSSTGVLVRDGFTLRFSNGSLARPRLSFGCGYDQQGIGPNAPAPTDGVLGLGRGKSSILSQLSDARLTRNVVGHCLGRHGGGYLFFGDGLVPGSGVTWSPMARSTALAKYYSPGQASIYFGTKSLGVRQQQMVFDSGSSFTYFALQPYQSLLNAITKELSGKPIKETHEDRALPVCWKGPKAFKSIFDVKTYFKSLVLNFVNGKKAFMEIPPENYLIVTNHGNACLGILNGTEVGLKDLNLIGDISMQDLMVVYNNENQQIGWVRGSCDRLPNADDDDDDNGFKSEGGHFEPQFLYQISALSLIFNNQ
ncbi:Aspartic peptidase A1 family protein [Dioscorea alata]|uniref:Aspartic peptidase A1 family protein n=1 Tax=Dioscorea alata TaxID=55571 RepID=A0ACB7W0C7_DIOAL|nr:Aspartic peptidase A1 family protein [Dioscorea alata]